MGKLFVRKMTAVAEHYEPRAFDLLMQQLSITQWHLSVIFSPKN